MYVDISTHHQINRAIVTTPAMAATAMATIMIPADNAGGGEEEEAVVVEVVVEIGSAVGNGGTGGLVSIR